MPDPTHDIAQDTPAEPPADTVESTREQLSAHLQRFRTEGVEAAPVIFGDRRRAEAVLLPYTTFQLLLAAVEDLTAAQQAAAPDAAAAALAPAVDPLDAAAGERADLGLL